MRPAAIPARSRLTFHWAASRHRAIATSRSAGQRASAAKSGGPANASSLGARSGSTGSRSGGVHTKARHQASQPSASSAASLAAAVGCGTGSMSVSPGTTPSAGTAIRSAARSQSAMLITSGHRSSLIRQDRVPVTSIPAA